MSALSDATAKQAFKQRVRHWAMQLEVPITWLAVCPMRHKWASCSTAGRLHFSTDLLPLDQDLWGVPSGSILGLLWRERRCAADATRTR